tara:strand:- start:129 stop:1130 length:1002 start_codon:yes stop_codon:yes gene_type:complete
LSFERPNIAVTIEGKYQFWRVLDHLVGGKAPAQRFAVQRQRLSAPSTSSTKPIKTIPEVRDLSDAEFHAQYVQQARPVVLKGKAAEWPCVQKWSMDWLREQHGEDRVDIFDPLDSASNEVNYDVEVTTLARVLDAMEEGDVSKYSRFNRLLYDHPELVEDFDWQWLHRMRSAWSSGKTYQVFIGGKGTRTSLHCAGEHNLFTQVHGQKHWYFIEPQADAWLDPPITRTPYFHSLFDPESPDFESYPGMASIQVWECTLEPGDVLFNPPFWWHQVHNVTPSIGVGFRWFDLIDNLKSNPTGTALTLLATTPPIWTATKHRTDFAAIFKRMQSKS